MADQMTVSRAMHLWVMMVTAMLMLLNVEEVHGGRPLLKQPDMLEACITPLFVFGASYMDVGENSAAMPFRESSEFSPYGIDYFGHPTGRFSNGRLVIDHICQELKQELMSPYLQNLGATFRHGVNFASSGSTACNSSFIGDGSDSAGLFSLYVQVDQFRVFHHEALSQHTHLGSSMLQLPQPKDFRRGIYIIESGNNDYIHGNGLTPLALDNLVAAVVDHIKHAIKILYGEGARTIVTMNAFPVGCFPGVLGQPWVEPSSLDDDNCVASKVHMMILHNKALQNMIENLKMELVDAKLIIFDLHQIFMDAIRKPASAGLKYVHKACCGYGSGDYNFDVRVTCGKGGFVDGKFQNTSLCKDRSMYMIWDSIHPTDTFSHHIAKAFVEGAYMQPPFFIKRNCADSQTRHLSHGDIDDAKNQHRSLTSR